MCDNTHSGNKVMDIRIGFGYDIHKLVQGRELFLGGLKIPSDAGL